MPTIHRERPRRLVGITVCSPDRLLACATVHGADAGGRTSMKGDAPMDFSRLSSNEKLAVYGAIASVVGPILASMGFGFGAGFITLLLALAMLAIVFLPQLSPTTTLPGSKGTLMLIVGGIAGISAALALISSFGFLAVFGSNLLFVLGWLIGIAGGLLMGWAGWQEFQREGGNFQLGAPASGAPRTGTTDGTPTVERTDRVTTVERTDAATPPGAAGTESVAPAEPPMSTGASTSPPTSTVPEAYGDRTDDAFDTRSGDPNDDRNDPQPRG